MSEIIVYPDVFARLLAGNITAEGLGLQPVGDDEETVAC